MMQRQTMASTSSPSPLVMRRPFSIDICSFIRPYMHVIEAIFVRGIGALPTNVQILLTVFVKGGETMPN
jgi:hypothetical protein